MPAPTAVDWPVRGMWLAERQSAPWGDPRVPATLQRLRALGVTHVAVGHEVAMPVMAEPVLEWGRDDDRLRTTLRRIRAAGLEVMLLPRIESPDFFRPPYPFRADIAFDDDRDWRLFHDAMESMLLHYAAIAREEGVAVFGLGLEMKRSVAARPERWREAARAVRRVYDGKLTYSANWYQEWEAVPFWDALDYVGIGAYFELRPEHGDPDLPPVEDVARRWRPVARQLARLAERVGRPVLFTEIGYTGWADTVERPWEWAGKEGRRGARVDLGRQAEAYAGLFGALGDADWLAGAFLWRAHTAVTDDVEDWEYSILERPAERIVRAAYRRAVPGSDSGRQGR